METLETEVRKQIAAEARSESDEERDSYVDARLTRMSNGELLTRISDALKDSLRP